MLKQTGMSGKHYSGLQTKLYINGMLTMFWFLFQHS